MAGKLPTGAPNKHVQKSYGGDTDLMKFYCTQNGTTYGRKWANFEPRTGSHPGTGYASNIRPAVYFNPRLDEVDNPYMRHALRDNYESVTNKSYRPLSGPDGTEPLPNTLIYGANAYTRSKQCHNATTSEERASCWESRLRDAPIDVLPHHKAYLKKIQPKDPVEQENLGYGPASYSSETKARYKGEQMALVDYNHKDLGPMCWTGFTHNDNDEPLSFHPPIAHLADNPAYLTDRPTGISITKSHFLPLSVPVGTEPLPVLANRAEYESAFTRGIKPNGLVSRIPADAYDRLENQTALKLEKVKREDPTEWMNLKNPHNRTSVHGCTMLGDQRPEPTQGQRLGNAHIGFKENTGWSSNKLPFVWSPDNPNRFITDNQIRFMDRTPQGLDREGHVWGGVMTPKPDGFTLSTTVNSFGPDQNPTATIRGLEPYVGRSIRARDQFYDEHLYDHKIASVKYAAPEVN